jgi:hypothetical protein
MTTIVATALVALGSSAGWFSDAKPSPKAAKVAAAAAPVSAVDEHNAALLYLAAVAGAQAEPNIRTETVYQYVDAPPAAPAPVARASTSAPVTAPATAPPVQAAAEPTAPPPPAPTAKPAPTTAPPPPAPTAKPAEPKPAPRGDGGGGDD